MNLRSIMIGTVGLSLLAPFSSSQLPILAFAGQVSLYLVLACVFILAAYSASKPFDNKDLSLGYAVASGLLVLYVVELAIFGVNVGSLTRLMQLLVVVACIVGGTGFRLSIQSQAKLFRAGSAMSFVLLFISSMACLAWGWKGVGQLDNPNTLGLSAVSWTCWAVAGYYVNATLRRTRAILAVGLGSYLCYASMSRTSLLALLTLIALVIFRVLIFRSKQCHRLVSLLAIGAPLIVLLAYIGSYTARAAAAYSEYLGNISSKSIDSGRQYLWPAIWDAAHQRPMMGWGLSARPGDLPELSLTDNLSSHNLYLQILLQSGWIGLCLWLAFLYCIITFTWKNRSLKSVQFLYIFLLVMLVTQCFEVTLIQNNFPISISFWIFCVCVFMCSRQKYLPSEAHCATEIQKGGPHARVYP